MTIEYIESVRYLCPACQKEWTGAKGAACEACYAKGWDAGMAKACAPQGGAGCACDLCDPEPVLIGKEAILCSGKGCIEEVKEEDDLCPSCLADDEEYRRERAEDLAYEMAKDDYWMRKIDERRGK